MAIGWKDLAFRPSPELSAEIAAAWEWLIGDQDWSPVVCSRLGDLFFERADGRVDWLSCQPVTFNQLRRIELHSMQIARIGATPSTNGSAQNWWNNFMQLARSPAQPIATCFSSSQFSPNAVTSQTILRLCRFAKSSLACQSFINSWLDCLATKKFGSS